MPPKIFRLVNLINLHVGESALVAEKVLLQDPASLGKSRKTKKTA